MPAEYSYHERKILDRVSILCFELDPVLRKLSGRLMK
jgi:hypothetical protein